MTCWRSLSILWLFAQITVHTRALKTNYVSDNHTPPPPIQRKAKIMYRNSPVRLSFKETELYEKVARVPSSRQIWIQTLPRTKILRSIVHSQYANTTQWTSKVPTTPRNTPRLQSEPPRQPCKTPRLQIKPPRHQYQRPWFRGESPRLQSYPLKLKVESPWYQFRPQGSRLRLQSNHFRYKGSRLSLRGNHYSSYDSRWSRSKAPGGTLMQPRQPPWFQIQHLHDNDTIFHGSRARHHGPPRFQTKPRRQQCWPPKI